MHGDEVVGRELLLQFIVYLCDNYGKSQLITSLIDNVRIHMVPTMNPDGYAKKIRGNANSIDLNRNFPAEYGPEDNTNREQPETRAVISWSKLFPFVLSANFHSGYFDLLLLDVCLIRI